MREWKTVRPPRPLEVYDGSSTLSINPFLRASSLVSAEALTERVNGMRICEGNGHNHDDFSFGAFLPEATRRARKKLINLSPRVMRSEAGGLAVRTTNDSELEYTPYNNIDYTTAGPTDFLIGRSTLKWYLQLDGPRKHPSLFTQQTVAEALANAEKHIGFFPFTGKKSSFDRIYLLRYVNRYRRSQDIIPRA